MKTFHALQPILKQTSSPSPLELFTKTTITTGSETYEMKSGVSLKVSSTSKRRRKQKTYKRRYYLASKLKDKFQVDMKSLTINTPYSSVEDIPSPERYYVRQALKSGFQHQLSIF
ncbi:hypothetical protein [Cyclobacterium sediminis]